jgi:hypothetical protein
MERSGGKSWFAERVFQVNRTTSHFSHALLGMRLRWRCSQLMTWKRCLHRNWSTLRFHSERGHIRVFVLPLSPSAFPTEIGSLNIFMSHLLDTMVFVWLLHKVETHLRECRTVVYMCSSIFAPKKFNSALLLSYYLVLTTSKLCFLFVKSIPTYKHRQHRPCHTDGFACYFGLFLPPQSEICVTVTVWWWR